MDETDGAKEEPVQVQEPEQELEHEEAGHGGTPGSSSLARKLLLSVLAAVLFGVVGYLIVPQSAKSTLKQVDQTLQDTRAQLARARAAQRKLAAEFKEVSDQLAEARRRIQALAESEKSAKSKVAAAEKFIAELNAKLESARQETAPLREQLAAARQAAEKYRAQVKKHASSLQQLQRRLQEVSAQRQQLAAARESLAAEKARLERSLGQERRVKGALVRLLGALDVGRSGRPPSPPRSPGEMPITVKELEYWMGQPSMTVQEGDRLTMRWGGRHVATAVSGLVTSIDGKPATRAVLASAAPVQPAVGALSGPWRWSSDQTVHYADLVALFGRPEGTSGTGRNFTAWWPVGAWGRTAVARVADGVVKLFDGRPADGEALCRLVPQRGEAYSRPDQAALEAARRCYKDAAGIVGQYLRRQAELRARDSWHLQKWQLAPFDSVGTWIAPTRVPAEGMTMRAALSCTWVAEDGRVEVQRRYVVVTISSASAAGSRQEDFAIFEPRD